MDTEYEQHEGIFDTALNDFEDLVTDLVAEHPEEAVAIFAEATDGINYALEQVKWYVKEMKESAEGQ